ncbi:MAG: hypothetical protein MI802_20790, partial [Desulfobacterales bacterium]|nr:hypothetical protein [Desulfobacterales bacterium]
VEAALSGSQETGDLAEALMFTPSGVDVRMSHGHREGFSMTYPQVVRLNFRVTGPVRRAQSRIGNDWALTASTSAMADTWAGATYRDHHPRAVRDVFYAEFDELLDALDGEGPVEYPSDSASVEAFNNEILAGFIRALYLSRPDYAGPIVYQERPQ